MAWRLQDNVTRGEIDNRCKGVVRGRIWIHGRDDPIILELKGNAHADLAGCLLRFENPSPTFPLRPDALFPSPQQGILGDLTASRKVRVFDVSLDEVTTLLERGETPPEHMANALYLEWFSRPCGRVVIEGPDWHIHVSAPEWRLTPEDEAQRARDADLGLTGFMRDLTNAIDAQKRPRPDNPEEWDEFDWEQSLRESDARTKKYAELLDKFGDSPDAEARIAEEMGWNHDESEEAESEDSEWDIDQMNLLCEEAAAKPEPPDPATEGIDWIRAEDGDIRHPLQDRCFRSSMRFWHECSNLGLLKAGDADLIQVVTEFQITSAKLAGALNGVAQQRATSEAGFIVACLKRALGHLHTAHGGLEKVAARNLLPKPLIAWTRLELFGIRQEILSLMQKYRSGGSQP